MGSFGDVSLDIDSDNHVALVELHRPPHNFFSLQMMGDLADAVDLGCEIFGGRLTIGLVVGVDLASKHGFMARIHGHGQIIRLVVAIELQEHVGEDVGGPGRLAAGRAQLSEGGIVAAENLGETVDEE